jgi:hypothetical protein
LELWRCRIDFGAGAGFAGILRCLVRDREVCFWPVADIGLRKLVCVMSEIEVEKIEGREQPIPGKWREALKGVADAFADGRVPAGDGIRSVNAKITKVNFENIKDYPDATGPLRDASWDTSICVWEGGHWQVLVDLTTVSGERSDLVLHAKVFELDDRVEIEPGLIYVP